LSRLQSLARRSCRATRLLPSGWSRRVSRSPTQLIERLERSCCAPSPRSIRLAENAAPGGPARGLVATVLATSPPAAFRPLVCPTEGARRLAYSLSALCAVKHDERRDDGLLFGFAGRRRLGFDRLTSRIRNRRVHPTRLALRDGALAGHRDLGGSGRGRHARGRGRSVAARAATALAETALRGSAARRAARLSRPASSEARGS
jgi:hypothetical protein